MKGGQASPTSPGSDPNNFSKSFIICGCAYSSEWLARLQCSAPSKKQWSQALDVVPWHRISSRTRVSSGSQASSALAFGGIRELHWWQQVLWDNVETALTRPYRLERSNLLLGRKLFLCISSTSNKCYSHCETEWKGHRSVGWGEKRRERRTLTLLKPLPALKQEFQHSYCRSGHLFLHSTNQQFSRNLTRKNSTGTGCVLNL